MTLKKPFTTPGRLRDQNGEILDDDHWLIKLAVVKERKRLEEAYRKEIERLRGDFECAVKEGRRIERDMAREREEECAQIAARGK